MTDIRTASTADTAVAGRLASLRALLSEAAPVVVAFSGGVDSSLLAWVANDVVGPQRAHAVTAVSPSLAETEHAEARRLAESWGLRHSEVETLEMESAAYRVNDAQRCAHCKDALMDALEPLAIAEGATVTLGVNLDDLGDHRPGVEASAGRGARFPLVEAGFTKEAVRAAARLLGLEVWDKPAAPCLASRLPYGTPVSPPVLRTVGQAEAALARLGFGELRVRHYGDLARIEVPPDRLGDVVDARAAVVAAVRAAGYSYVTLDLEGLRSGNLNAALDEASGASSANSHPAETAG
ncbi:MAG: ATP-dependent sacrificial sulfur transferase LarE [bacterium]|nr:ATP-dependent sacrificial sulfur transferase LarE [bacterium]